MRSLHRCYITSGIIFIPLLTILSTDRLTWSPSGGHSSLLPESSKRRDRGGLIVPQNQEH
jgi:hypothetical protein